MPTLTDKGIELEKPLEEIEGGFTVIPDGIYSFEIAGWKDKEAKTGKKEHYIQFNLRVVSDGEFKGAVVADRLSLSPDAVWRWKQLASALGIIKGSLLPPPAKFMGKKVNAEASVDLYEDDNGTKSKRNRISNYTKFGAFSPITPASTDSGGSVDFP